MSNVLGSIIVDLMARTASFEAGTSRNKPERPPKRPRRIPDVHHGGKLRRGLPEHQPACDTRPGARRAILIAPAA